MSRRQRNVRLDNADGVALTDYARKKGKTIAETAVACVKIGLGSLEKSHPTPAELLWLTHVADELYSVSLHSRTIELAAQLADRYQHDRLALRSLAFHRGLQILRHRIDPSPTRGSTT